MITRHCGFLYGNKCPALEWDGDGGGEELCVSGQEYSVLHSIVNCSNNEVY